MPSGGSRFSDVLAEFYIEPMRRTLIRAGFRVSRFADDFRVVCRSYDEALSAWETADEAARELGLVLNENKTSTPRRSRYAALLTAISDQERALFTELEVESLNEPEYGDVDEDVTGVGSLLPEPDFNETEVVTEDVAVANGEVAGRVVIGHPAPCTVCRRRGCTWSAAKSKELNTAWIDSRLATK